MWSCLVALWRAEALACARPGRSESTLSENGREKTDDQVDCSDEEDGIGRVQVAVRYELREKKRTGGGRVESERAPISQQGGVPRTGFPDLGSALSPNRSTPPVCDFSPARLPPPPQTPAS